MVLFSQIRLLFPEEGLVYDYKLYDAGLSSAEEDLDEDVIREVKYFTFNSKLGNLGPGTRKQHSPAGSFSHQGQIRKACRSQARMFKVKSCFSVKEEGSFLSSEF